MKSALAFASFCALFLSNKKVGPCKTYFAAETVSNKCHTKKSVLCYVM